MTDQANEAIDPMDAAAALIANSLEESDPPEDDEEQDAAPEDAGEESEDAETEEEGATEAPKEVVFAGQKFDLPANTPPEVVEKVAEIGKQLQGDYTRKTQELASREKQAAEIVQNELNQGRQRVGTALEQANLVAQALFATGRIMSRAQIAELAQVNPSEAFVRQAELNQFEDVYRQLTQQAEQQKQEREDEKARDENARRARLAEGTDKTREYVKTLPDWSPKVDAELSAYTADWGQAAREEIAANPVFYTAVMKAMKYDGLTAQKPAISKKVAEAPQLPKAKQPMPQEVRQKLDARKAVTRKGGASMRDLAAFIATNQR